MKKKNVNQLVCFDNSLKGITSNLLEFKEGMQQYSTLYTISFIKDFHYRSEHNKVERNNTSPIIPILRTIPVELFTKTTLEGELQERPLLDVFWRI